MSTSKYIDKICIVFIVVGIVLCFLFMGSGHLNAITKENVPVYQTTLFDNQTVHQIDIIMDDWDKFIENCESEEYSLCSVIIDGEKYSNVAIRAKGNTSLSNVKSMGSQRYSFKLEFDHYDKNKSYHGLDKLCLNNLIQDNTMMKDYLVYQLMTDFGVDSPLCSYSYITVNGEDWGLYLAVEGIEEAFLERNYGADYGELYKPDSLSFGGGRGNGMGFDMDDFDFEELSEKDFSSFPAKQGMPDIGNNPFGNPPEQSGGMPKMSFGMGSDDVKLKYIDDNISSYANIFDSAKTDITDKDKERLIASLKQLNEYTDINEVVDIEEVIRYFVVHNFVVNGDSYTGSMIHNYYLYEKDGQLSMIPWDYNLAFGTFMGNASSSINDSIDNPVSDLDDRPMFGWIFSNEEYINLYHDTFNEFVEDYLNNGKIQNLIKDTYELIKDYVDKDPTKFCTSEEFETAVNTISSFIELRSEAVKRQLNNDNTAVETDGLNLSDMGSMSMNKGKENSSNSFMSDMGDFNPFEGNNPLPDRGNSFPTKGNNSFPDRGETNFTDMKFAISDISPENNIKAYSYTVLSIACLIAGLLI
ncbi:MAG: CotH kinase family protein, partial [Erysipelotrichaceae bacterium]|nr:CotH kinase family protein [Erysipelotrichaceae bacterium]